eukprot:1258795-Prorocentrum_lima.AAC.1
MLSVCLSEASHLVAAAGEMGSPSHSMVRSHAASRMVGVTAVVPRAILCSSVASSSAPPILLDHLRHQ